MIVDWPVRLLVLPTVYRLPYRYRYGYRHSVAVRVYKCFSVCLCFFRRWKETPKKCDKMFLK